VFLITDIIIGGYQVKQILPHSEAPAPKSTLTFSPSFDSQMYLYQYSPDKPELTIENIQSFEDRENSPIKIFCYKTHKNNL